MKSQRRHDLQQNQLAKGIIKIPTFLEQHGNKVFIAVIVICLAFIIYNWRTNSSRRALATASDALASARTAMTELRNLNPFAASPLQIATMRTQLINDIRSSLTTASEETDDRTVVADATLAKGDLNWLLATLPSLPGSATQPTLRLDIEPTQALDAAEQQYKKVLDEYADQKLAVIGARFGLAAIAENRGQWTAAKQQYDSLVNDSTVPKPFQTEAKADLDRLPSIQSPAYLATPAPTSRPTTTELLTPAEAPLGPASPTTTTTAQSIARPASTSAPASAH